jgi:hypothetical protein
VSNNEELPARMDSKSKPVRLLLAVAAGASTATGALAVIPGIPGWIPAMVGAIGLILSVAVGKYVEDSTTPWTDVAAKVIPTGETVAGPASNIRTGATVEVTLPEDNKE